MRAADARAMEASSHSRRSRRRLRRLSPEGWGRARSPRWRAGGGRRGSSPLGSYTGKCRARATFRRHRAQIDPIAHFGGALVQAGYRSTCRHAANTHLTRRLFLQPLVTHLCGALAAGGFPAPVDGGVAPQPELGFLPASKRSLGGRRLPESGRAGMSHADPVWTALRWQG